MDVPEVVNTARLRLILVTMDDAAAMVSGARDPRWHREYPRSDDVDAVAMVARGRPEDATWGPRHIVLGHEAVGTIGFFGAPEGDEVEVGFGLVPAVRGSGLASEALAALLWETDRLGVRVRASVDPANRVSVRILAGCGFTDLRGSNEDGHLVMVRPVREMPDA